VKLAEIGEFGLIGRITGGAVFNPGKVVKGIGDDAAVLSVGEGQLLLVSCDMLVDGVHFAVGKITPFKLGYKAIAVSLSDIAAMGGVPRHVLVSLGLPPGAAVEDVEGIYAGMRDILSRWSVNLVGGDTVKSPVLTIDVMVMGEAAPADVVTRGGARPGDILMVTGHLGGSAAGLELLLNENLAGKLAGKDLELVLTAHLTPAPRLEQSAQLVKMRAATSMIDLSDGLAGDVRHICENSAVGAEIYVEKLPVLPLTAIVAQAAGKNAVDWALGGGEDYELLFTVPPERQGEIAGAFQKAGLGPVTAVGKITADKNNVAYFAAGGKEYYLKKGFDHFSKG